MAHGLLIYDAAGNVILDTADRITKVLGVTTIGTGSQTGSLTDARFANGTPFWCAIVDNYSATTTKPTAVITTSGTTLYWDWGTLTRTAFTLIYGIY